MECNTRADIVRICDVFDYSVIVLSNHLAVSKETRATLASYVKQGGTLIIDGRFGFIDEFSMQFDTIPAGDFSSFCGEAFFDFDNGDSTFTYNNIQLKGVLGREQMCVTDGTTASVFKDGLAAAVEKRHDTGTVICFNTDVWYSYTKGENSQAKELASYFLHRFNLTQAKTNLNLRLRVCENAESYLLFAFNYSNELQEGDVSLLLCENEYTKHIKVKPNDVKIVKFEK